MIAGSGEVAKIRNADPWKFSALKAQWEFRKNRDFVAPDYMRPPEARSPVAKIPYRLDKSIDIWDIGVCVSDSREQVR